MADNYLEKKMQDHAAGRGVRPASRAIRAHVAAVIFVELHTLPVSGSVAATLRLLAESGARIELCVAGAASTPQAAKEAQRLGARLLPFPRPEAIAYTLRTLGPIDLYLSDTPESHQE